MASKDEAFNLPPNTTDRGLAYHRASDTALRYVFQESACASMMSDLLKETDLEAPLKRTPTLQYLADTRAGVNHHLDNASHYARTAAEYGVDDLADMASPPPLSIPGDPDFDKEPTPDQPVSEGDNEHNRQRAADHASLQNVNGVIAGRANKLVDSFVEQAQPDEEGGLSPLLSTILNRRPDTGHPLHGKHGEYNPENVSEKAFIDHNNRVYTGEYVGRLADQEITGTFEKMRLLNKALHNGDSNPESLKEVSRLIGDDQANMIAAQFYHIMEIYKNLSDGRKPTNQSEWIAPSLRDRGLTLIPGMADMLPAIEKRLEGLASLPDDNNDIESPNHPRRMAAALATTMSMRVVTQAHAAEACQAVHGPNFLSNDRFLTRMAAGEWEQVESKLAKKLPPPLPASSGDTGSQTDSTPEKPKKAAPAAPVPPLSSPAMAEEGGDKMKRKGDKPEKEEKKPNLVMAAKDKVLGGVGQLQQLHGAHEKISDITSGKEHAQLVRKHLEENNMDNLPGPG